MAEELAHSPLRLGSNLEGRQEIRLRIYIYIYGRKRNLTKGRRAALDSKLIAGCLEFSR